MLLAHPDGRFAGTRVPELVRTVDLLPTVLAWLGVAAPAGLDGIDLSALLAGAPSPVESAYTEQREYFPAEAIRTPDWLLARDRAGSELRLYRRRNGRASERDVAADHPEVVAELAPRLDALESPPDPGEPVRIPVPAAVKEQLRALGYLEE
jgi:arylsulfatase A-like enzyme